MTGEEYLNLTEGDLCRLITNISTEGKTWKKGLIVKVLYRDRYKDSIYFKNPNVTSISADYSIKELGPSYILGAIEVYKKHKINYITKFGHTFNVGDDFWIMENNKPVCYTIREVHFIIAKGGNKLLYFIDPHPNDDSTIYTENEMFRTKEELLKSFL